MAVLFFLPFAFLVFLVIFVVQFFLPQMQDPCSPGSRHFPLPDGREYRLSVRQGVALFSGHLFAIHGNREFTMISVD